MIWPVVIFLKIFLRTSKTETGLKLLLVPRRNCGIRQIADVAKTCISTRCGSTITLNKLRKQIYMAVAITINNLAR